MIDPQKITKEELVELYANLTEQWDDLKVQIDEIRSLLLEKLSGDGEVVGDYQLKRTRRLVFFPNLKPKEKVEIAKSLGATKDALDTQKLKKLYKEGKIKDVATKEYIVIKRI